MARSRTVTERDEVAYEDKPTPGFVRVDLMPGLVLDARAARRARLIAICLILLALLLVLGWRLYLQVQLQSAQDDLIRAEEEGLAVEVELARYSEVGPIVTAAEQGQQALTLAMGSEVRWSFLLNQLSFATPAGVELTGVGGQISQQGTVESSPGDALPLQAAVGTMKFTGTATDFATVAEWLDSLQGLKDYTYPFLTDTAKERTDDSGVSGGVTWDSEADLSPNALSGRYGEALPAAPAPQQEGEAGP